MTNTFRGPDGRSYEIVTMNGARVLRATSPAYPSALDRERPASAVKLRTVDEVNDELQRATFEAEGERVTYAPLAGPEAKLARAVFYRPKRK